MVADRQTGPLPWETLVFFSLLAGAITDFKAAVAMAQWYYRMCACYGPANATGFAARSRWNMNYFKAQWTKKRLKAYRVFGVTHAILFSASQTDLPVLYDNGRYKMVKLSRQ